MTSGLNSFEVQKTNRLLVLKLMLEVGSITRAELAQRTGLKKSTITNILYILNPNNNIIEADYPKCDAFIGKSEGCG